MRRLCLLGLTVFVLVALPADAAVQPNVRSVSQRDGHVLIRFTLGDLAPGQVVVATRPRLSESGALAKGIKLRDRLPKPAPNGIGKWRSAHPLPSGLYYVQISGIDLGGVTDCKPRQPGCGQEWSKPRRVVIPAK
jgi:hypothetical protein